ncbi:hypothetical protein LCGC14_2355750 [marine sediment metagenome]|uniref:Uncharacterized protein n=1 Tax=marine sediment metagenome TaxID=412755 RepID=A0A0F9F2W6_9ZZZZ
MEYANEIWVIVWGFTVDIFRSPANYAILVSAWFAVEVCEFVFSFLASIPKMRKATRLKLHALLNQGKRTGSTLWCMLFTWFPYAQPDLCGADRAAGCQTIMDRMAIAVVLGLGLSVGHRLVAPRLRKLLGRDKLHGITCSNCRTRIKVASLEDACPECGEVPLEVTAPK